MYVFANPVIGTLIKRLIFPWGSAYYPPKDTLKTQLAFNLCQDKSLRDAITPMCYLGKNEDDAVAVLNQAMDAIDALAPLAAKVKAAQQAKTLPRKGSIFQLRDKALAEQVITQAEAEQIAAADELRKKVVKVDEFDFDLGLAQGKEDDVKVSDAA